MMNCVRCGRDCSASATYVHGQSTPIRHGLLDAARLAGTPTPTGPFCSSACAFPPAPPTPHNVECPLCSTRFDIEVKLTPLES